MYYTYIRCQSLKYENGVKHTGGTWRQFSFFIIIELTRQRHQVSPVLKSIFIYRTLKLKLCLYKKPLYYLISLSGVTFCVLVKEEGID